MPRRFRMRMRLGCLFTAEPRLAVGQIHRLGADQGFQKSLSLQRLRRVAGGHERQDAVQILTGHHPDIVNRLRAPSAGESHLSA